MAGDSLPAALLGFTVVLLAAAGCGMALLRALRADTDSAAEQFAEAAATALQAAIDKVALHGSPLEHRLLGPAPCPIPKLRGMYRYHILLSSPAGDALREAVRSALAGLAEIEGVQWVVDVDPVDLL